MTISRNAIPFMIMSFVVGIGSGSLLDYFTNKTFSFTENYEYPVTTFGYFDIFMVMVGFVMLITLLSFGIPIFKASYKILTVSVVSGLTLYFVYFKIIYIYFPLIAYDANGYYYYTTLGEVLVTLVFIGMLSPIFYGFYRLKKLSEKEIDVGNS